MSAALSIVAVVLGAAPPELVEARELFKMMRFRRVEEALTGLRAHRDWTIEERREGYDLLAYALGAQGKLEELEAVYVELLVDDPDAQAPVGSAPKIVKAFRRAQQRAAEQRSARGAEPSSTRPAAAGQPPVEPVPSEAELAPGTVAEHESSAGTPTEPAAARPTPAPAAAEQAPRVTEPKAPWLRPTALGLMGFSLASFALGLALGASSSANSSSAATTHFAADAIALDANALRLAIAADTLFVAAVGSAVVALVLWWVVQ